MAHLEIGGEKKSSFELAANFQYTVGRGTNADWRLQDEPFLSRLHAQVSLEGTRLKVKRLPSASNPIFHTGVQSDEFFVEHGDIFVIGATRFKFIADKTAAADPQAGQQPETEHLMAADEIYADESSIIGSIGVVSGGFGFVQAIKRLGRGLAAVAWAPDGIVDGVELADGAPFVLGVQWHPEDLVEHDPAARRLFAALVTAAARR